jgi:hypothetical protein
VPTGWVEVISLAADRGRPRAHWPYSLRYPRELSTTLADVFSDPEVIQMGTEQISTEKAASF